ncbi:MAG: hypothetical protein KDN22_06360 [Verrucomicrobiae bacterium]|nr:hypothetical protein [Verrucomicrobiae bacterium]
MKRFIAHLTAFLLIAFVTGTADAAVFVKMHESTACTAPLGLMSESLQENSPSGIQELAKKKSKKKASKKKKSKKSKKPKKSTGTKKKKKKKTTKAS